MEEQSTKWKCKLIKKLFVQYMYLGYLAVVQHSKTADLSQNKPIVGLQEQKYVANRSAQYVGLIYGSMLHAYGR